jgi:hypothetical protein
VVERFNVEGLDTEKKQFGENREKQTPDVAFGDWTGFIQGKPQCWRKP